MEAGATGALGSEAQTQIRLARIETRLDAVDDAIKHVITLLEGRQRLSERCMDLLQAFVTGPNVKWLALLVLGLAAILNGVALSGYGISLGGAAKASANAATEVINGE